MIVVGIVGSPAGGKSTVAATLAELGATWVNADLVAREVLETSEVQSRLIEHFGPGIADEGGRIDRSRLASRVFGDDDLNRSHLRYLESVVHPRTREHITARLRQAFEADPGGAIVILDVPLLFESGWDRCCDEIVCVDCVELARQLRASARGWTADELRRREQNQWPMSEKKRLSTRVIGNDGELEELQGRVRRWYCENIDAWTAPTPATHLNC